MDIPTIPVIWIQDSPGERNNKRRRKRRPGEPEEDVRKNAPEDEGEEEPHALDILA